MKSSNFMKVIRHVQMEDYVKIVNIMRIYSPGHYRPQHTAFFACINDISMQ